MNYNYYLKINIDNEFSLLFNYDLKIKKFYNNNEFMLLTINVNKNSDRYKYTNLKDFRSKYINNNNNNKKLTVNEYRRLLLKKYNRRTNLKDKVDIDSLDNFEIIINLSNNNKRKYKRKRYTNEFITKDIVEEKLKVEDFLKEKLNMNKLTIYKMDYNKITTIDIDENIKKELNYEEILEKYSLNKFSESEEFIKYKEEMELII